MATWHTLSTRFKYQAWAPFGKEKAVLSLQWTANTASLDVHARLAVSDKVQTSSRLASFPLTAPRGPNVETMVASGQFDPAWEQAKQWADTLVA